MTLHPVNHVINEAHDGKTFLEAARLVEARVKMGLADNGLIQHLAIKGHALIVGRYTGTSSMSAYEISQAVLEVLAAEPPFSWPDHDLHPCRLAGEHLSTQRHPKRDCSLFFGENEGDVRRQT